MDQVFQDRKVGSKGEGSEEENRYLQEERRIFFIQVNWGIPTVQETGFYVRFLSIFNSSE